MEKKNQFSRADSTLMGNVEINYEIATALTSSTYTMFNGKKEITDFNFYPKEQLIYVTFRQTSLLSYPDGSQSPDKVWREVYGIKDNKLLLLNTIEGKHTPGYYIEETIEFPEENEEKKAED